MDSSSPQRKGALFLPKGFATPVLLEGVAAERFTSYRSTLESCVHGLAPLGLHHLKELRDLQQASVALFVFVVTAHAGNWALRRTRICGFVRKCLAVRNRQVRRMRQAFERFHAA